MQSQTVGSALSGNINLVQKNKKSSLKTVVNNKGVSYPEVTDIRTGQNMVFPDNVGSRIPKENRVSWYRNQSKANLNRINSTDILCKKDYIDEWYKRGYTTPKGGWKLYEIHHIKPREFGGSADFENMVPLLTNIHRKYVTPWWNSYGQKKYQVMVKFFLSIKVNNFAPQALEHQFNKRKFCLKRIKKGASDLLKKLQNPMNFLQIKRKGVSRKLEEMEKIF